MMPSPRSAVRLMLDQHWLGFSSGTDNNLNANSGTIIYDQKGRQTGSIRK
jgi:hypothetical protein